MKRFLFTVGALAAVSFPSLAAEDPIAVRQELMLSNAAAAAVARGIAKGEIPYSPLVGKTVIYSMSAAASAFGDYFPEGSLDPARSEAAPKIWEDMSGFLEAVGKYRDVTSAAKMASGRAGPADIEAFNVAMGPVLESCKTCHESYKTEE